MEKSESIKSIAKSMAHFMALQGKIKKDAKNPFHKSNYATLEKVLSEVEPNLLEANLSYCQFPDGDSLTTILMHIESGEFIQASYNLHLGVNKEGRTLEGPQHRGSAITYARRYALCSILGLSVTNDDDGETAQDRYRKKPQTMKEPAKAVTKSNFAIMSDMFLNGESDVFNGAIAKGYAYSKDQIKTINQLKEQIKELENKPA